METPRWKVRECSVRLRRCDGDHEPPRAKNYNKSPLVWVKAECDAEDAVVSQEPGAEITQALQDVDLMQFLESFSITKTENEIDDIALVKQELDIGPTLLQERAPLWPTPPQSQASGDGVPPEQLTTVQRADAGDHYLGRESGWVTTSATTKTMTPRTSHAQIRILIEYMERNGDICRPHEGMQGRLQSYRRWTELTDILNAQGSGCTKSIEKWKKFWADLKSKTKKKAASIRSHRTSTGGGPATSIKLSIFEERIMAILGVASSIGLWSESGFPDSDEEIQSRPASAAAVISIPVALQHSDPPHTITSQTRPPSIHPSTSIMSSAGPSTSQTQYIHPPTQPFFESGPSPSQTHINPSTPIDLYTIPTTSQTHVHLSTSGTSSPESSTSQIQIHPFTPIHFTPTTTASQRRVHPPTPLQETQHVQPSSTHSRQISFTQPATRGAEQDEQTIPESVSQSPIAGINPSTRPTGPRRPPDSRRRRRFPTPFQMATEAFADIERSRIELERARMQQMDRLITMIERIGERFIELTDHMINRN